MLRQPGLRAFLARGTKLAWALHALGPARIWAWDRASAWDARLVGVICGTPLIRVGMEREKALPCKIGRYRANLHALLNQAVGLCSPARARRMKAERSDPQGNLARILEPSSYQQQECPSLPGLSPVDHYLQAGQYAGLNPHPLFWQFWYARLFLTEVNGITPWHHFLIQARTEPPGNDPNLYFSSRWYSAQSGALQQDDIPLLDYLEQIRQGLIPPAPNPEFTTHNRTPGATEARKAQLSRLVSHESPLARQLAGTTLPTAPKPSSPLAATPAGGTRTPKIAVCAVLTGNYDPLRDLSRREANVDYYLLTDRPPQKPPSGWQIIVIPPQHPPLLQSRYLKMNLMSHLPQGGEFDAILYLDGNVELYGSVISFVHPFLHSDAPLGVIPHPFRRCVYDEAAAVMHQQRDIPENTHRALAFLAEAEFPPQYGLFEMNCFCFKPGAAAERFLAEWWQLFQKYGNRDQLLAPYVVWQQHLSTFLLMPQGMSVRTHPSFTLHAHGKPLSIPSIAP